MTAFQQFVQQPPVVQAVQWDGTEDGAVDVSKFFQENFSNLSIDLILTSWIADGTVSGRQIKFEARLQGLHEERMRDGDWVIAHANGSFEILPEEAFNRQYKRLETES